MCGDLQRKTSSSECAELEFVDFPGSLNCRGFFGLLFSSLFGLFIPRVLDTWHGSGYAHQVLLAAFECYTR